MTRIVIGLGSNLDAPRRQLSRAADAIDGLVDVRAIARSNVYESEPLAAPPDANFVVPAQPRYLNAAVLVETARSPHTLLRQLLAIETRMGRVRDQRWGPRVIDLDLLWSSDGALVSPTLTLPHPDLERRAFALAPLLDVMPTLIERYGVALARCGGAPACVGQLDDRVDSAK